MPIKNYAKRDVLNRAAFSTKSTKERITIWVDEDVLDTLRARAEAEGIGYQALINRTLRAALDKRLGVSSSNPKRPRARRVWFSGRLLKVELVDGRVITGRYDCFPRLRDATKAQRENWRLIGQGLGIHWPDVDEDLSTDGLLRDAISVAPSPRGKRVAVRTAPAHDELSSQ